MTTVSCLAEATTESSASELGTVSMGTLVLDFNGARVMYENIQVDGFRVTVICFRIVLPSAEVVLETVQSVTCNMNVNATT